MGEYRIFIEATEAASQWTKAGHLYLVLRNVENGRPIPDERNDRVIRGGPANFFTALVVKANVLLKDTDDNYKPGDTPESRYSVDITSQILTGSGHSDAQAAWAALAAFATGIDNIYNYEFPSSPENHTANSNALILSVLNSAGVDIHTLKNKAGRSYLDDSRFEKDFPGATYGRAPTLLGSGADPVIAAGDDHAVGLVLLGRDDVADLLIGTRHADRFYGEQDNAGRAQDTVSYAAFGDAPEEGEGPLQVELQAFVGADSSKGYVLRASDGPAKDDELYGIEKLTLTRQADVFKLHASAATAKITVDMGAENGPHGDVLDLSAMAGPSTIINGVLKSVSGADTLTIVDAETVIGSWHGDRIDRSGEPFGEEPLQATPGPRLIYGLAGDDWIVGSRNADVIETGAGYDTVVTGEGSDTIIVSPTAFVRDSEWGYPIYDYDMIVDASATDRLYFRGYDEAGETEVLLPIVGGLALFPAWEDDAYEAFDYDQDYFEAELWTASAFPFLAHDFSVSFDKQGADLGIRVEYGERAYLIGVRNYEEGDLGLTFENSTDPFETDGVDHWREEGLARLAEKVATMQPGISSAPVYTALQSEEPPQPGPVWGEGTGAGGRGTAPAASGPETEGGRGSAWLRETIASSDGPARGHDGGSGGLAARILVCEGAVEVDAGGSGPGVSPAEGLGWLARIRVDDDRLVISKALRADLDVGEGAADLAPVWQGAGANVLAPRGMELVDI